MNWIDNARVVAVFAVVFLHVSLEVVFGAEIGSFNWWVGNIYNSFVRWCVPLFVMISGFLLLDPEKNEDIKTFYAKRVSRILIPLVFWSVFFSIYTFLKGMMLRGEHITLLSLGKNILQGVPYGHMWFLYMILGLYLITPFFRKLVKALPINEASFFCMIMFAMALITIAIDRLYLKGSTLFINWYLPFLPYYLAGYLIGKSNVGPYKCINMISVVILSLLTAAGCYMLSKKCGIQQGLYFYNYLSITVIPASLSIFMILKEFNMPIIRKIAKEIAPLTLGIYIIHIIFIEMLRFIAGFTPLKFTPFISIPASALIVFLLSVITCRILISIPSLKRVI